jgi:hypothetical protein
MIKKIKSSSKREKDGIEAFEMAFYSMLFALLCPQPAKRA